MTLSRWPRHEIVSVTLHYILVNNSQNNDYLGIYHLRDVTTAPLLCSISFYRCSQFFVALIFSLLSFLAIPLIIDMMISIVYSGII